MQGFSPVASNKLYIQIYNQLREAIVDGRFGVGDKLPSEKELCQTFGVSRVPVREALCALELNGLVDSIQGGGVYVKSQTPAAEVPQGVEPQDIIRARMVLEPDIAREAALHLDAENRKELKEIMEKFLRESAVGVITKETDRSFHLAVARASGSSLYSSIMELVFRAMEQELWDLILSRTVATEKYRDQNNREHINICQAILDGRPDDAHAGMKAHMEMLYERYWGE